MTARALIQRQCRVMNWVIGSGAALFVGALVADQALGMPGWVWFPGLLGFAVAFFTMVSVKVIGIHCPICGGRLEDLLIHGSGPLRNFRFCVYCGTDLGAEAQEKTDIA